MIVLGALAISLTMPYLEPYLIRTMKVALKQIEDPVLAADVRSFSAQEGHHFRNTQPSTSTSARASTMPPRTSSSRSSARSKPTINASPREESLAFNVGYAEGFEALTCSGALALAEHGAFTRIPGQDLFTWHMAEEIEHRTVAFDGVRAHRR